MFFKWPFVGVIVETFGFLNLFGYAVTSRFHRAHRLHSKHNRDFFPVILTFLRQLPFVGSLLQLPYIRDVSVLLCTFCRRSFVSYRLPTASRAHESPLFDNVLELAHYIYPLQMHQGLFV